MKIGAAVLIHKWGRPMQLIRDGFLLVDFKGRFYNNRPEVDDLQYSVEQQLFRIIAVADDFAGSPAMFPQKFDVVKDVRRGLDYTVQYAYGAGAESDEVFRMVVKGGQA